MPPRRVVPGEGQESVWDYPRPPRVEPTTRRIRVDLEGSTIVDTTRALRVLETSHPPVYYLPLEDVLDGVLEESARTTFCEWKGLANYYGVRAGQRFERDAAWAYLGSGPLSGRIAFYAGRMTGCFVDDERVEPQPGGFYGGWITRDLIGPFKGGPGTMGW